MVFEQLKGNRVAFGNVTCVVDMQMVSAVEAGQYLHRAIRITHSGVEIDHAIEFTAVANPRVDLPPHLFIFGTEKAIKERVLEDRTFERWDCGPDGPDS